MQEDHRRKPQRRRVVLNLNKNVITQNGIVLLPISQCLSWGRYLTDIDSKQHAVHAPQYTVYNADSPNPLFPSQRNARSHHSSVRPALYLSACGCTVLHTTSISPNARPHAPGPMSPFLACISASSISTHNPLTSALEVDLPPSHIRTPYRSSPYSQSLIQ